MGGCKGGVLWLQKGVDSHSNVEDQDGSVVAVAVVVFIAEEQEIVSFFTIVLDVSIGVWGEEDGTVGMVNDKTASTLQRHS